MTHTVLVFARVCALLHLRRQLCRMGRCGAGSRFEREARRVIAEADGLPEAADLVQLGAR